MATTKQKPKTKPKPKVSKPLKKGTPEIIPFVPTEELVISPEIINTLKHELKMVSTIENASVETVKSYLEEEKPLEEIPVHTTIPSIERTAPQEFNLDGHNLMLWDIMNVPKDEVISILNKIGELAKGSRNPARNVNDVMEYVQNNKVALFTMCWYAIIMKR